MKAYDFDKRFDSGEDVTALLDIKLARRPNLEPKRVNVDFPVWMVDSLDREARKRGITRQSLIKFWLADRIESHETH